MCRPDTTDEATHKAMGKEAKFVFIDKSRMMFIRFGKVRHNDVQPLLFEDEPPPWEYFLVFEHLPSFHSEDARNSIKRFYAERVGKLFCDEHHRAAHITVTGSQKNFGYQIEVCCETFRKQVERKMNGGQSVRSKSL